MKKILVVEDDKKVAMALAIRLRSVGYEVMTVHDALTGVSAAVKFRPDLVILDISMPAGGGFTVAERLEGMAMTAATPIIFMTASKQPGLREKAMAQSSAIAFFDKPYDAGELIDTIASTLGEAAPDWQPPKP